MGLKETIKPITYLKNNAAEVVREAHEKGRLLVVTQNGEAKAVVMSIDQYDEWKQTLAMLKLIALGEADIRAGRLVEQDVLFQRMETVISRVAGDD
ncbi:MAG: type II toxin-antitoxin system Phd/YefM family antitoxin [Bradymonadales bacterium]|nr:type II toxin-antitoxin system Phd/YefM family antitoxin [Bradymonadales bacterium]